LLEPHEGRVVTITFMEPAEAAARDAKIKQQQAEMRKGPEPQVQDKAQAGGADKGVEAKGMESQLESNRKLKGGSGRSRVQLSPEGGKMDVVELAEEVEVLREELLRAKRVLREEKGRLGEQEQAEEEGGEEEEEDGGEVGVGEEMKKKRGDGQGNAGTVSSWQGYFLLSSNLVLLVIVGFLILVLRKRSKQAKRGQHIQ
jgi:hypothetical protein